MHKGIFDEKSPFVLYVSFWVWWSLKSEDSSAHITMFCGWSYQYWYYNVFKLRNIYPYLFLFCLFVWDLSSHSRIFSLIWRCHHYRWRAANFDLCAHSWPLISEGSLACHTYCGTGHPFIMSSPRTRDTHTYCWAFSSGDVTICFTT